MDKFKNVDEFIRSHKRWNSHLKKLRAILKSTELKETVKWGAPVYTINGKNVAGLGAFKSYVGLWFFQGVFLSDPNKKLINAQEGVTKAMRQWRFQNLKELDEKLVLKYLNEAIANQKAGKEIKVNRDKALKIPSELLKALADHHEIELKFKEMGKTLQREYADHIAGAKREETKKARLEKILPMILDGKGLYDKYKK